MLSKRRSFVFLLTILTGLATVGLYLMFRDTTGPELMLSPSQATVSRELRFTVEARDKDSCIRLLTVTVIRGDTRREIARKAFPGTMHTASLNFTLGDLPFDKGMVEIEVAATDSSLANFGAGNTAVVSRSYALDTVPPRVQFISDQHAARQGGSCVTAFTLNEEITRAGVTLADTTFPAFSLGNDKYACFFPFPHGMDPAEFRPMVTATDKAGNTAEVELPVTPIAVDFKEDDLNLPDSFLERKDKEFEGEVPGKLSPLQRYLKVNGEMRKQNNAVILAMAEKTEPAVLWSGPFGRLPKSQQMAGFGDHRSYLYKGEKVDEQTHMGIDLASIKRAEVPAANSGKVVFADYLGIYGNAVVIDHGMGLMSLYSHLSEYTVEAGQNVDKDQIIGKTGVTGLAGGDHLHFGIYLHGIAVNPLEWWDAKWIENNVTDRI